MQQIKINRRKKEKEIEKSKFRELKDVEIIKEFLKKQKSFKEKEKYEEEKYQGIFQVYGDIFPKIKNH